MPTEYFRSIAPFLPTELAIQLEQLCQGSPTEPLIDALIRFVCGAECPETLSDNIRSQWSEKQQDAKRALSTLFPSTFDVKRPREGDDQHVDRVSGSKRQRLTPSTSDVASDEQRTLEDVGQPVFTLCAISATSPVRKKVDITIHKSALRFASTGSSSIEATVPLSALHRAFLLPTRGKSKAHWTVVLISSDTPDRGKLNSSSAQPSPQVIFGIDATTSSPLTTVKYDDGSETTREMVPKGNATLPSLNAFLSHLGIQVLEPTADVFKSACSGYGANAGQGGIPGVEAYRAAKVGSLWFMKEGILWGESKPCEFWAVEDLLSTREGLRLLPNAGGRTCSVTLTRKGSDEIPADEDVGVETEFTMIDSREQDGISQWVRAHQHLFGRKGTGTKEKIDKSPAKVYRGPVTIHQIGYESDSEDEDFHMKSLDDDSENSDSSNESEDEGSNDDESEAEARDSDAEGEDEEELKEENHPLLRRGAVPRMSKAAMNMVVNMVEEDFLGRSEDAEEDELDE
ncbi:histone chaperone Rttp106-like-domain-containing protein [Amanita rubescens]|nr:histone chaperone Rttp106-like-domain-containing protein [Amanita rubescens]